MKAYVIKCIDQNSVNYHKYFRDTLCSYTDSLDDHPAIFWEEEKADGYKRIKEVVLPVEITIREIKEDK
jgi:hypothetical protein